jgi:hypothetical protein
MTHSTPPLYLRISQTTSTQRRENPKGKKEREMEIKHFSFCIHLDS